MRVLVTSPACAGSGADPTHGSSVTLGKEMLPELKSPWEPIGETAAVNAVAELSRELGPTHPLKRKKVHAVAARRDCDDVLFVLPDEIPACAVVHLTYTGKEEPPHWPETRLFASLEDWSRDCMIPDYEDYHAGE